VEHMQSVGGPPPPSLKPARPPVRLPTNAAEITGRGAKKEEKAKEKALLIDRKKTTFTVVGPANRTVRSSHGTTYWNAVCRPPVNPGKKRSAKFVFESLSSELRGAIGMVPPDVDPNNLHDWLGYQTKSVAVWLDGTCRFMGERVGNASKTGTIPIKDSTQDDRNGWVMTCELDGTTLTISHAVAPGPPQILEVVRVFHGVPTDWCFAVGAFGGRVRVMRAGQTVDNQRPRAVVGDIVTFGVPDGDLGAGGSDVFVRFDVLDEDGDPVTAAGFPDGVFAVTDTQHEAGSTCSFPDEIPIALPPGFTSGILMVTVFDEDNDDDDVLYG